MTVVGRGVSVTVETTVRKVVTPRVSDIATFKMVLAKFRYQKIEAVDIQPDANSLGRMKLDVRPAGELRYRSSKEYTMGQKMFSNSILKR
jgi:hypothetical protein